MEFKPFDYQVELVPQRALFCECFPETIGQPVTSTEHYHWKFQNGVGEPSSYEYGAYENDELIGYYAAISYPYIIDGQNITAGMVCDVMTGVKARGKGVFTRLGVYSTDQLKENGVDFSRP